MAINNLKDMLIRDEGLKLMAYKGSNGYWHTGVGHNLETNTLSTKVVMQIMRDDIDRLREEMADSDRLTRLMSELDTVRNIALINMAFQLGVDGLLKFKNTLTALEQKQWHEAYNHALDSKWFREDSPNRAQRVAQVLLSGTFNAYNHKDQSPCRAGFDNPAD